MLIFKFEYVASKAILCCFLGFRWRSKFWFNKNV